MKKYAIETASFCTALFIVILLLLHTLFYLDIYNIAEITCDISSNEPVIKPTK